VPVPAAGRGVGSDSAAAAAARGAMPCQLSCICIAPQAVSCRQQGWGRQRQIAAETRRGWRCPTSSKGRRPSLGTFRPNQTD
jgi:hypothetical protein